MADRDRSRRGLIAPLLLGDGLAGVFAVRPWLGGDRLSRSRLCHGIRVADQTLRMTVQTAIGQIRPSPVGDGDTVTNPGRLHNLVYPRVDGGFPRSGGVRSRIVATAAVLLVLATVPAALWKGVDARASATREGIDVSAFQGSSIAWHSVAAS